MGNQVCLLYEKENVICPPQLKKQVFSTACVDNLDHNPSSRTAKDSFHGTAISVTQHPTADAPGIERYVDVIDSSDKTGRSVMELPQSYARVPPLEIGAMHDIKAPGVSGPARPAEDPFILFKDIEWLEEVSSPLHKEVSGEEHITWSAFHAAKTDDEARTPATTALLPLFRENAHSFAMIAHAMSIVHSVIAFLNPGQTPVLAVDQPLFAIAKQLQWHADCPFTEDNYVIMMGGLHIEMASLKLIDEWLQNSGWATALVYAGVTTAGKAEALAKASHVTRSRYVHQVTACSLYVLQQQAYAAYKAAIPEGGESMDFTAWCERQAWVHPQFQYWKTALHLELLVLQFIWSLRESNIDVYVKSLHQLAPWFFALDHYNYARWLPVHIRDMVQLQQKHPTVLAEFNTGYFTVQKSSNKFSAFALDQSHEQENAKVKGDGGAVGLTESEAALRRWMVAGPEVARAVNEFENCFLKKSDSGNNEHHEQKPSVQKSFHHDVESLLTSIEEMGNPFSEDSSDVMSIDTKYIMPAEVVECIYTAEKVGKKQYDTYVEERLEKCTKPISDTIKRNNLALPGNAQQKVKKSADQKKLIILRNDCNLFSRLYIACQARGGNLDDVFRHGNAPFPPALSSYGRLRQEIKSELLKCLEVGTKATCPDVDADAAVLDGAAVVNMLAPQNCKTFEEYVHRVFLPYIMMHVHKVKRVDIVWDRYFPNSLKSSTREIRGSGIHKRVTPSTTMPSNWQAFLRDSQNKEELFKYLAECTAALQLEGKVIVTTYGDDVLSGGPLEMESLAPCNHEEADTRLFLHVSHAVHNGNGKIMIRSTDTDVVVLAITLFEQIHAQELWVAMGTAKQLRYIPVHKVHASLGPDQSKALAFFHAFTGCDTTSSFSGRAKKTCFDTWQAYPTVTQSFLELSNYPKDISNLCLSNIERYVVLLYQRTSPFGKVNQARQALFAKGSRTMEHIPPSEAALIEHTKRACYQAGYVWRQSLQPMQDLPCPTQWGWIEIDNSFRPKWSTLP